MKSPPMRNVMINTSFTAHVPPNPLSRRLPHQRGRLRRVHLHIPRRAEVGTRPTLRTTNRALHPDLVQGLITTVSYKVLVITGPLCTSSACS